jgi:PIN domain nuclease of toxin-antitoxin system
MMWQTKRLRTCSKSHWVSSVKVLLDTNALLWLLADDPRLSKEARQKIEAASEIFISEVSLWEIAIKISIKKLSPIPTLHETVRDLGFTRLHLEDMHLKMIQELPMVHRDPFDRMLVAQAMSEEALLVTSDAILKNYGVNTIEI